MVKHRDFENELFYALSPGRKRGIIKNVGVILQIMLCLTKFVLCIFVDSTDMFPYVCF